MSDESTNCQGKIYNLETLPKISINGIPRRKTAGQEKEYELYNYNHIQGGTSDRSDLGKPHLEEWKEKRETKKSEKKTKAMHCISEHN